MVLPKCLETETTKTETAQTKKPCSAPKLGILTRVCWNGRISFETFIETEFLLRTTISIDY